MVVEGPCVVSDAGVTCKEGGKVHIMKPAHTIDAAGKAADSIIAKISANPNNVDPKVLVPPRQRH